jgi:hypothetical protein
MDSRPLEAKAAQLLRRRHASRGQMDEGRQRRELTYAER